MNICTVDQYNYFKKRFEAWCLEGMPRGDEEIKDLLQAFGDHEGVAPIFSCTGHEFEDTIYIIFGVTEEGLKVLSDLQMALCEKGYRAYNDFITAHPETLDSEDETDTKVKLLDRHATVFDVKLATVFRPFGDDGPENYFSTTLSYAYLHPDDKKTFIADCIRWMGGEQL